MHKGVVIKKIVYQVYPISFQASPGNSTGDLQGIIKRLPYIKSLGVDYVWVQPFFRTAFRDNGYDVIDYYAVDPKFGTQADLESLIKRADEIGLKIMLDMVFNHTSTESAWFKGWLKGDTKYQDFYISRRSVGKPPTNWVSKFGGSAWKEYKPNHWYLHLFDETQADLNWDNPKVRQELKKVLKYYVQLGVRGYRFDVINLVSKGEFVDDTEGDGRRFYTDGPRIHDYVSEIASVLPSDSDFFTVGELSSTSISEAAKFSKRSGKELNSVFTFRHLKVDYDVNNKFVNKAPDLALFNSLLQEWSVGLQKANAVLARFLNNHDQPRALSRFILDEKYYGPGAKMLLGLMATLPGPLFIYQGEEIGMTNPGFKDPKQYRDVETLNYLKANHLSVVPLGVQAKSRDNGRTPMQWTSAKYAGFSTVEPWIETARNYTKVNVEAQDKVQGSVLNFYRETIKLVKEDAIFEDGKLIWHEFKNDVIFYTLVHGARKVHVYASFNKQRVELDFKYKAVVMNNYPNIKKPKYLEPYQFLVLEE